VIHCGHNSVTIYFATLATDYLAGIALDGSKHLKSSKDPLRVALKRTRKYNMLDTKALVDLLKVLVHLLIHLTSGNAHVGYLFNYDQNPLHNLVLPRSRID
jgi:hypothetical protein